MAEHQKVHPVHDPEAATPQPTAPLVPRDSSRSDKGDPAEEQQQQPPLQRKIPYSYSKPPKRNCCKRCLCWTFSLILILIIILAIAAGIIYLIFRPKIPKYSIDGMRISQFNLNQSDMSLYATFNVNITARNPNKKIGIYYESGSHISVLYTGRELCEGSLPKFYQGHKNTTVLDVVLTGQTNNAADLLSSLQAQQQQTGSIPLNLRVKAPITIKLGKLMLMKWKFLVKCSLVVDNLTADNAIRIRDDSCKFRFRGFD